MDSRITALPCHDTYTRYITPDTQATTGVPPSQCWYLNPVVFVYMPQCYLPALQCASSSSLNGRVTPRTASPSSASDVQPTALPSQERTPRSSSPCASVRLNLLTALPPSEIETSRVTTPEETGTPRVQKKITHFAALSREDLIARCTHWKDSRKVQREILEAAETDEEWKMIIAVLLPIANDVVPDEFGNYIFQKLLI